jgi:hypothetical protein
MRPRAICADEVVRSELEGIYDWSRAAAGNGAVTARSAPKPHAQCAQVMDLICDMCAALRYLPKPSPRSLLQILRCRVPAHL